ncbi:MAG: hypothetical protein R2867_45610 [Caldilineaceae bacterium]
MSVSGIQRVGDQLRPRFIGGNPPDVIDNSGAGNRHRGIGGGGSTARSGTPL